MASPVESMAPSVRHRSRSFAAMTFGARIASGVWACVQTMRGSATARCLPGRIRAIAASAYQKAVRPPVDPAKDRIVTAVEEILHQSRKRGEVLGRGEDITIGGEHIAWPRRRSLKQTYSNAGLRCGPRCRRLSHLARSPRQGMIDDQLRFHPALSPGAGMAHLPDERFTSPMMPPAPAASLSQSWRRT